MFQHFSGSDGSRITVKNQSPTDKDINGSEAKSYTLQTGKPSDVLDKHMTDSPDTCGDLSKLEKDAPTKLSGEAVSNVPKNVDKHTDSKGEKENETLTVEQVVALSYPEYKFDGAIIYSYNSDDCNILCDDLLSSIDTDKDVFMGFDTEWPVTFQKGKQAKTALIQICLDKDKCFLFHVSCMAKFPAMLKKLIEKLSIKKVGLNVEYDLWKLETDYDIRVKNVVQSGTVELKTLANKRLKTAENWSLEGLTKNVLRMRLSKDPSIRTCDWSQFPLPEAQKRYAASDAAVSLILYKELMKIQR